MSDSGNKIKAARMLLTDFYKQPAQPKISLDIDGLSHRHVARIMFGNALAQFALLIRFILFNMVRPLPFAELKNVVYRLHGMHIGKNVYISPSVYVDPLRPALIHIDDNVMIGMDAAMMCHERTMGRLTIGRIRIDESVCIGGRVIIRCGVSIGANAIIDMQNAVGQDIPAQHIVVNKPLNVIDGKADA